MNKNLNILFLCNKSPWPAREGGPIAMSNIIGGLIRAGHKVKVLALNTNKYVVKPEDIPDEYKKKTRIEFVYINLSINPVKAFLNLFSKKSFHVERFKSKSFERKLISVLKQNRFDIVQIELLFMSPYLETIRKYSAAKIVLRAHNIEHLIWERLEISEKNLLKKHYLRHLATTLKNYEIQILNDYDGIVPITKKDSDFFEFNSSVPVHPVSFGIDLSKKTPKIENPENALFHIGAMNWLPNEEGIRWFLEQVWPKIHQKLPEIKLYLAGREMPEWLQKLEMRNVIVIGEVEDAASFIQSKSISIAPLFSGSGIRVKIIESMSLGKAVISTSIGAEGINCTNGNDIIIADTPDEFANAIELLYTDPARAKKIGEHARNLVSEQHDSAKIIDSLVRFYQQIL